MENKENAAVAVNEKGRVTFSVAGQEVTLSYQIVKDFLTKGNGKVCDQDLTNFISICKYNQLNPFLSEAYLVKFGDQPAQMIVSKEALMKRAEANESYDGLRGGVIVQRGENIVELDGCFYLPKDVLLGGWAEVFRKDRKYPIIAKVRLDEYDKKQSIWKDKPSSMISKVAKVQALREAFPSQLGAMYTSEEKGVIDIEHEDISTRIQSEISQSANKEEVSFDDAKSSEQTFQSENTSKEIPFMQQNFQAPNPRF